MNWRLSSNKRHSVNKKMFVVDTSIHPQSWWKIKPFWNNVSNKRPDYKRGDQSSLECYNKENINYNSKKKKDYEIYVTDSEEETILYDTNQRAKIFNDSDDLCQRISELMKKTRMNSLQRK